jgi:hypothetical protein
MRDTIDMAREVKMPYDFVTGEPIYIEKLKAFEALVRADEREACARIAEEPSAATYECTVACGGPAQTFQQRFPKHSHDIAKEIRARGEIK